MYARITQKFRHLVQAFIQFDSDSDGHLSLDEFLNAMQTLSFPCSHDEQVQIFRELDQDRDKLLNYDEFCSVKGDFKPGKARRNLIAIQPEDVSVAAMNDSLFKHPLYYMPKKRRLHSLTMPLHDLNTSIMGPVVPTPSPKGKNYLNQSLVLRRKPRSYHRRQRSQGGKEPFLP
mmetsp:Transcript_33239/g.58328  ORF Transcript_33239/g.58328 Transcript_33239/m.58328 type:complete len:174 (+) Transcript_33239:714-1235(+)